MKIKKEIAGKGRRAFLSHLLTGGAVIAASGMLKANKVPGEKIKLLTPEGKLVEVDKSVIEGKSVSNIATNQDVIQWMKTKSAKI